MTDDERESSARDKIQRGLTEPNHPLEWSEASCLLRLLDEARVDCATACDEALKCATSLQYVRASLVGSQEDAARLRGEIDRLRDSETAWIRRAATALATMNRVQEKELRDPPGADALAISGAIREQAIQSWRNSEAPTFSKFHDQLVARALEQHAEQAASAALEACALHIEGGGWRMQTVGEAIRAFGRERATAGR